MPKLIMYGFGKKHKLITTQNTLIGVDEKGKRISFPPSTKYAGVYVISLDQRNLSMGSKPLCKIGMSASSLFKRLDSYKICSPEGHWNIGMLIINDHNVVQRERPALVRKIEKDFHEALKQFRYHPVYGTYTKNRLPEYFNGITITRIRDAMLELKRKYQKQLNCVFPYTGYGD